MDIGIGLPATIPGTTGDQIVEWARAAEESGFTSLGVIDRLVYGNAEPLVTLGAVAAVTSRIRLVTSILLVPFRANAALVAKQAATVNHLSGRRLMLGMAVGGYRDDYEASGVPFTERGRRFDRMLEEMSGIWEGQPRGYAGAIGPSPGLERSQILIGGMSGRAYARAATWGAGWIAGSRGAETFQRGAEGVRKAWTEHGREDTPRLLALPYFSLGPRARPAAEAFMTDHYAIEGPATVTELTAGVLTDKRAVQEAIAAYEQAGCDELLFFPCSPDSEQVRLLAEAVR